MVAHRLRRSRSRIAAVSAAVLSVAGLAGAAPRAAQAAPVTPRTITLAGSLQSELGCSEDWQPSCAKTVLPEVEPGTYAQTFDIPAGSYEYKIAVDGAWTESYGVGGAKGGANMPLVLGGPARVVVSYDDSTHLVGIRPLTLAGATTSTDKALAKDSLRAGLTKERFYFVMADRFANGDTRNDQGGITGTRLDNGFDPSDKGFYHGGDLAGVTSKLDYIKGLGTTAIWLTPSFTNKPVQGTGADASAGYHGYWTTDFTRIDPHLGGNVAMKQLIDAAHAKGMKVFFDIITNHTADVIDYQQKQYSYISKDAAPYEDASGQPFDDAQYATKATFPALDAATSFPYTPVFRAPEDAHAKTPAWLNDPTMYHNRGDSTWAGESATYGDFVGLDDLFTERPEVVKGMGDIYSTWSDFGIDGFRIDTVKHVNMGFWQQFVPRILDHTKAAGKNFFMFGEVYDGSPKNVSPFTTTGRLPAALDFPFQGAAVNAVQGKATTGLRDLFADDDYYTDTDSNAYELPTFLGNHDMGRVAMMLQKAGFTGADLVKRLQLANSLMYLTRGQPVVYYGDEQGFIGSGGDKDSREDMFATKVAQYAAEPNAIGPAGAKDRYDTSSVLYRQLAGLAALRTKYPALADGAQIHRFASDSAGIYAFSRVDRSSGEEFVVAVNTASSAKSASFASFIPNGHFAPVYGATTGLAAGRDARVTVTVPALGVSVWKSYAKIPARRSAPAVYLTGPAPGEVVGGRAEISASLDENVFAQVTFAYRPVGTSAWTTLGTDDNAPYRVFHDVSALPKGELLEYRAVVKDRSGNIAASSSYGIVGEAKASGGATGGVGPVTQPASVSVPGTVDSELGCPEDWQPGCEQAQLTLDAKDQIWKKTATVPAGDYSYKFAIDKSWDENYGAGGAKGGANIDATLPATPVTWYYDHQTHYGTSDAQGPIITAPGSYQAALGCGADWAPDCMRPWLQDPDGDGTYTWSTDQLPAGNYSFKIAHGLSWDENYGAGGALKGDNIALSVPSDNVVVTISYVLATHVATVKTSKAGAAPDLKSAKAIWVDGDTIAWPASALPAGVSPSTLRWRLAWAPQGGLAIDAETISAPGSREASLSYDPAGITSAVLTAHPELKGYVALQLDKATARQVPEILKGQVAVGLYDTTGRLLDATGTQLAYALDALYPTAPRTTGLGVSFIGSLVGFKLWAPTARSVRLLTWPASSPADAPVSAAKAVAMTRDGAGVWSARVPGARDARYLYEVTVFAPSTGRVEKNLVTDPASVALTPGSTKSVAVNLADGAYMPRQWLTAKAPRLDKTVDSTIYELHVRDFSIKDTTVPAAHRGSYLAFADDGAGTRHLRELAKAGLNTVHLLPTFDIATIEEDKVKQAQPACDLASYAPDSKEQQACIAKIQAKDGFNWGYDPFHWSTPEGSYASSVKAADGGARVAEFRTMVGALHADGLRVVLDQVFNHTNGSGQAATSVLDKVVPGYYHRLDAKGAVYTSTCCQNIATEHAMGEKALIDSVVLWAKAYKVDGFRFDLMGHHSAATMTRLRAALDGLSLRKDGVDGRQIYLYGEGWNFGEVADNALFRQASQGQLGGTHIGTFSDRLRDAVRGGTPFDEDPRVQGFGSGLGTDLNDSAESKAAVATLGHATDLVQLGLAGNLKAYTFRDSTGKVVRGDQVDYRGAPAGYADQPDEVISYVDAHDNETLFDSLTYKLPVATSMSDRVRMNTLSLATTALAQTPSFWHAGVDLLRSKSLDRDSYDSGDWFNAIDWSGADNGFGHGLPMSGPNSAKYAYMQPLLANRALKPAQADALAASAQARELLAVRASSRLFRLGAADLIKTKVSFPASGTAAAQPGVIAMRIDDTVGPDADPRLKNVVVVFNATPKAVTQVVPGMAGHAMTLSPVQAGGADAVVKTAGYDRAKGAFTVPARTVAVFVE